MSKVALPMVGIFDTTLGRLVGISPEGATDVTTVATVETNLVTGGIELSAGNYTLTRTGTPIELEYSGMSGVSFNSALDAAINLSAYNPVNFHIVGVIPLEKFDGPVVIKGDCSLLNIYGDQLPGEVTGVVASTAISGGFEVELKFAAQYAVSEIPIGSVFLIRNLTPPNTNWNGISGAYLITARNTATNTITVSVANAIAPTGAVGTISVDCEVLTSVLNGPTVTVLGDVGGLKEIAINGGDFDTQTESRIRGDGNVAVIDANIAFDIGGLWGGYVGSLYLYAGVTAGFEGAYAGLENPNIMSKTLLGGYFCNGYTIGANLHLGAYLDIATECVITNATEACINASTGSRINSGQVRFHNSPIGLNPTLNSTFTGSPPVTTDVTAAYSIATGVVSVDGSAIYLS